MTPDHIVQRFKEQAGEILALKAVLIALLEDNPKLRLKEKTIRNEILKLPSSYGVADLVEIQFHSRAVMNEILGKKPVKRARPTT